MDRARSWPNGVFDDAPPPPSPATIWSAMRERLARMSATCPDSGLPGADAPGEPPNPPDAEGGGDEAPPCGPLVAERLAFDPARLNTRTSPLGGGAGGVRPVECDPGVAAGPRCDADAGDGGAPPGSPAGGVAERAAVGVGTVVPHLVQYRAPGRRGAPQAVQADGGAAALTAGWGGVGELDAA